MKLASSVLALAALSSSVLAGPYHRHFHAKRNTGLLEALTQHVDNAKPHVAAPAAQAAPAAPPASGSSPPPPPPPPPPSSPPPAPKSSPAPSSSGSSANVDVAGKLASLGSKPAENSQTNNGAVWIGSDGPYTNEFVNNANEAIIVVVWGSQGSWVNAVAPHVAVAVAPGASQTVSFADGQSGAWAGVYSDTQLVNGQIANTWGEFTFKNPYSTFDVSREVNMNGKGMSIESPNCVSDMKTCVFQCTGGATSCLTGYELDNCATGSQQGAQYGTYGGAASGGCGGLGATAKLKTTFT